MRVAAWRDRDLRRGYQTSLRSRFLICKVLLRLMSTRLFLVILSVCFGILLLRCYTHRYGFLLSSNVALVNEAYRYAAVVDCGSSGSRVYLYRWTESLSSCLPNMDYVVDVNNNAVSLKVTPGLSSLQDSPDSASNYLLPLLVFITKNLPQEALSNTPLYILATAGMRLLSPEKQDAILTHLRMNLPRLTQLQLKPDHIQVITGKEEGVFMWASINYLLGRLHGSSSSERVDTVGSIEVGGASTQIAYAIPAEAELPSDLTTNVNLGCSPVGNPFQHRLYVTTFLGFGVHSAYQRYLQRWKHLHTWSSAAEEPCLPVGVNQSVILGSTERTRVGTGKFYTCYRDVSVLLNSSSTPCASCSGINNVPWYPWDKLGMQFYGFSELWYSTNDIFHSGESYQGQDFINMSQVFCATPWSDMLKKYSGSREQLSFQCFKSAWIAALLHRGFRLPLQYPGLTVVHNQKGKEVQWTLGALLLRIVGKEFSRETADELSRVNPAVSRSPVRVFLLTAILLVVVAVLLRLFRIALQRAQPPPPNLLSSSTDIPSWDYFHRSRAPVCDRPQLWRASSMSL